MILNGGPSINYRLWAWLLTKIGHAVLMLRQPKVTGEMIDRINDAALPGDVLVRDQLCSLAHWMLPGKKWIHSGIVVNNAACPYHRQMAHAIAPGVTRQPVTSFCQTQDRVGLYRPRYPSEAAKCKAIEMAERLLGTPYDFWFKRGNRRLYCHEYVLVCLEEGGLPVQMRGRFVMAADNLAVCDLVLELGAGCKENKP